MADRIPPLEGPPLLLAEGGANVHAAHSSLESFRLAVRLGATAVGARALLTVDGALVLARDDTTGGLRRRRVSALSRADLAESVPTLAELVDCVGSEVSIALTVADDETFRAALQVADAAGATSRLWIRHAEVAVLGRWRDDSDVRLINSVRIPAIKEGLERRAADLRAADIDGLEARASEWSGGLVALLHRFRRLAWATDANHLPVINEALRMGLDAIGGDHPDRLVDATTG